MVIKGRDEKKRGEPSKEENNKKITFSLFLWKTATNNQGSKLV